MNSVRRRAVTEIEAALYIGMSRSWLAQARMNGSPDAPPFLKIGRSVRYLIDDLDRWLASRRRRTSVVEGASDGQPMDLTT